MDLTLPETFTSPQAPVARPAATASQESSYRSAQPSQRLDAGIVEDMAAPGTQGRIIRPDRGPQQQVGTQEPQKRPTSTTLLMAYEKYQPGSNHHAFARQLGGVPLDVAALFIRDMRRAGMIDGRGNKLGYQPAARQGATSQTVQTQTSAQPSVPPGLSPELQMTWNEFEDGMSDHKLADRIGVSRPTAGKYIGQLVERGLIVIEFDQFGKVKTRRKGVRG